MTEISRMSHRKNGIPSAVLGMLVFVVSELMFFMALISSLLVIKATTGVFAPPEAVRLPILTTGFNTLVLLISGALLVLAGRNFGSERSKSFFAYSIVTGAFFVLVQGYEWFHLLKFGLTLQSGIFGACFFVIIGTHALHAIAAIIALAYHYRRYSQGVMPKDTLTALQIFWGFIVLIWPLIYGLIYF